MIWIKMPCGGFTSRIPCISAYSLNGLAYPLIQLHKREARSGLAYTCMALAAIDLMPLFTPVKLLVQDTHVYSYL